MEPTVSPKIVSGVGDPSSPLYGQLLSVEDEKRLDSQGREIVKGLPWSRARTGLYLLVFVSSTVPQVDRRMLGGSCCSVSKELYASGQRNRVLTIGTFNGKPVVNTNGYGLAIELPADLGLDRLKQRYLTEWLVDTAKEALESGKVDLSKHEGKASELALWVAMVAEKAIRRAGL